MPSSSTHFIRFHSSASYFAVVSALMRTSGFVPAPRRLNIPLPLWVSPAAFSKSAPAPLNAPTTHIPKSSSDKSLISIPPPSIAGKRLATFSSVLHPCQSVAAPSLYHDSFLYYILSIFLSLLDIQIRFKICFFKQDHTHSVHLRALQHHSRRDSRKFAWLVDLFLLYPIQIRKLLIVVKLCPAFVCKPLLSHRYMHFLIYLWPLFCHPQ